MATPHDKLNEVFDIEVVEDEVKDLTKEVKKVKKSHKEQDYDYVRGHLTSLMEKGAEIVDGAMEVADQTQHPRAYEVALNGVKGMSEVAEKLIDLQQKMKALNQEDPTTPTGPTTVNNTLMVGTLADLMGNIKELNSGKPEE